MNLRDADSFSSSTPVGVVDGVAERVDGSSPLSKPPYNALRLCLELQAAAPRRSVFSRVLGVDAVSRAAQGAYRAAMTELTVVDVLDGLGSEWSIVHSVPVGGGIPDIEHLAVGPAGVFSIVTRCHTGQRIWVGERTFMADDERFDYILAAEDQGIAAARLLALDAGLEPTVTPCIVVGRVASIIVRKHLQPVEVVTARHFASWLHSLPRLLSPTAVAALRLSANTVSTNPHDVDSERDLIPECERLRSSVRFARVRLFSWTGIGIVTSWTVMILNCR